MVGQITKAGETNARTGGTLHAMGYFSLSVHLFTACQCL